MRENGPRPPHGARDAGAGRPARGPPRSTGNRAGARQRRGRLCTAPTAGAGGRHGRSRGDEGCRTRPALGQPQRDRSDGPPNGSQLRCPRDSQACGGPAPGTNLTSPQGSAQPRTPRARAGAGGDCRARRRRSPLLRRCGARAPRGKSWGAAIPPALPVPHRCPGPGRTCPQQDTPVPKLHDKPGHYQSSL